MKFTKNIFENLSEYGHWRQTKLCFALETIMTVDDFTLENLKKPSRDHTIIKPLSIPKPLADWLVRVLSRLTQEHAQEQSH